MDFNKKRSTSHAVTNMTGKIREQVDSRKYGCRIFADFHTVDHAILAQKLNYYGV